MHQPLTVGDPVWGDPAVDNPYPSLEGDERADVCVVGLGGSGLAAVTTLREAGADVVGIDAGPVGGGAAGRNAGFLLAGLAEFHHRAVETLGRERAVALYRLTLEEIDRLAAELGPLVRRRGSVRTASGPAEADDIMAHAAALEVDRFPAVLQAETDGKPVLVVPSDAEVDPLARCRRLAGSASCAGARLYTHTPAVHVTGTEVTTPAGRVTSQAVVVAVDGGLERLLPELKETVRSTRLQMLATAPVHGPVAARPVYGRFGYDYHRQLDDGRVVLGGGRDRHAPHEWEGPPVPSAPVQADLETLLADLGVTAPVTHRWAGVVAYTGDRLPVLAEVRSGVLVAGAYSGHGNVLGSMAGRAVAAIALGQPAPHAARLLRPDHWGL